MRNTTLAALSLAAVSTLATSASAQQLVFNGSVGVGAVATQTFTIGTGTYIDATTNGSVDTGTTVGADTEIALYSGTGPSATLVASIQNEFGGGDDDDGVGVNSTLSYGTGSGLLLGDTFNLGNNGLAQGEDGAMLAPGTYTLVIGEFSTFFTPTLGAITDFGDEAVTYTAAIYTDAIPEPAALTAVAGAAGLAAVRRRRAAK